MAKRHRVAKGGAKAHVKKAHSRKRHSSKKMKIKA